MATITGAASTTMITMATRTTITGVIMGTGMITGARMITGMTMIMSMAIPTACSGATITTTTRRPTWGWRSRPE